MKKISLIVVVLFIAFACGSEGETPTSSFDVQKLRSEFITQIETPAINAFTKSIDNVNATISDFVDNPSEVNLESLKNNWRVAAKNYSAIEILNLGEIRSSLIMSAFYTWNANEIAIEKFINSSKSISEDVINSLSTSQRGLSAIEYLLFEKSATVTITDFSNQRRKKYLKVLGENLVAKAALLQSSWTTYRDIFISNKATDINGGVAMIINQTNVLLENIRRFKIGEPAGLERTTATNVTLLQAEKSEYSLQLIAENLASIKKTFFDTKNSIDHYLFYVTKSQDISAKVDEKFTAIHEDLKALSTTTLKDAITEQPTKVKKLYNNIKDLIVIIKTDVASALSITITFTDNDGD